MPRKTVQPNDGILVAQNITKRFGDRIVLDNISLAVEEGKTTVIIGPSGCGKTVFMKHLIVLERPTKGQVFFKGQRIDDKSEADLAKIRTRYGFCFQMGALFDSLTVYQNVIFPIEQLSRITKQTDVNTKELYQLFPGGAAKVAAKISGLGKPTGCI